MPLAAKSPNRKNRSSRAWMNAHVQDPYVQRAEREGFRSRAAYKLDEIGQALRLWARAPACVVDLGAAPGAWSQLLRRRLGARCNIQAIDLLPMPAIPGVQFQQGDFREAEMQQLLLAQAQGRVDWVLSDMSPDLSGVVAADQARIFDLAQCALEFALAALGSEGVFVCKVFQGSGFSQFVEQAKRHFSQVRIIKPAASRPASAETYLTAANLKGSRLLKSEGSGGR